MQRSLTFYDSTLYILLWIRTRMLLNEIDSLNYHAVTIWMNL